MSSWLDVALLAVLIVLNGVFAMSEISLVTSRRARLQRLIDDKVAGAERARELNADPNRALSTIQVGITSIGILSGIVGESALARPMEAFLVMVGLSPETAKAIGLFVVVVLITYFSIVMGELVPKRIGQISPERIALSSRASYSLSFHYCRSFCQTPVGLDAPAFEAFGHFGNTGEFRDGRRDSRHD